MRVVVDSSVLLGMINPRDIWHERALALRDALLASGAEVLFFDCVAAEVISAAARRLHEKKLSAELARLFDALDAQVPPASITWIFPDSPRLYLSIIDMIRSSAGALNFNDALIVLACRERGVDTIASFDSDLDQVKWLHRAAHPQDISG